MRSVRESIRLVARNGEAVLKALKQIAFSFRARIYHLINPVLLFARNCMYDAGITEFAKSISI